MPFWVPSNEWEGSDAYVIGGGPSLRGFDWAQLKGKHTIGCNFAFRLGAEVCALCFFSDIEFFAAAEQELRVFKGRAVTHCHSLTSRGEPWLLKLRRMPRGLHTGGTLGFGNNSGCGAVNLALSLGARRVFMLGFDCTPPATPQAQTHWHDWRLQAPKAGLYDKFMGGWQAVAADLPRVFPGRQIINLNPDSAIPFFPKATLGVSLPWLELTPPR